MHMDERGWLERAEEQLYELVDREHAVVWPEVEAKLAESRNGPQPHILTKARNTLVQEGDLATATASTRGGREVTVLRMANLTGRERAYQRAAGRKRLLQARFQSWSTKRRGFPRGLVGPAGERVVHESLIAAAPYGYRLHSPGGGDIHHFLGSSVEGGSLDNAAFLQVPSEDGLPGPTIVLPIEVKNIRSWIYPSTSELYQLLHKGALLQAAHPSLAIVPVLVCRRRSFFVWAMAKELGFFPIEVAAQFVLPRSAIDHAQFNEVRNELGYRDLELGESALPRLVQALETSLPREASKYAARWKVCGPPLAEQFEELREHMAPATRQRAMADFRDEVSHLPDCKVGW